MTALNAHVASGVINRRAHPVESDVFIYNYSPMAQYDRAWDDHVLQSRGLVVRADGLILARPLPKFFNFEEVYKDEKDISQGPMEITEKYDGSLGIVFYLNNEWQVATRGSFESDQAKEGKKILDTLDTSVLDVNYTYLFEIIY